MCALLTIIEATKMVNTSKRMPTTPGEILDEEFLRPLSLTQKELAQHLGCDIKVINRIVNGRCAVSAEMAIKLSAAFQTSADFWLNAQRAVDLYKAAKRIGVRPKSLLKKRLLGNRAA